MAAPEQVVPDGSVELSPCDHCGGFTRTVWGWVKRGGVGFAVYYARWPIGHREAGASLAISLGGWGPGEDEAARRVFAFDVAVADKAALAAVDAEGAAWLTKAAEKVNLGKRLTKAEAEAEGAEALRLAAKVLADDERARAFVARGGRDTRRATELIGKAQQRVNDSDDVGAEVDATQALGWDPEAWEAYFIRGWARLRAEELEGAQSDLETFLAKAPRSKNAARATKLLAVAKKRRSTSSSEADAGDA